MNSFRGRISRSKIVQLKKVLVQLSECLTEEINNLIDEEQFRPRRLWVRKWIHRRETNLTVSPSDHLIVFCISKYTQKTKSYCKNSPRVYYHAVDTVLRIHSGVIERLVLAESLSCGEWGKVSW